VQAAAADGGRRTGIGWWWSQAAAVVVMGVHLAVVELHDLAARAGIPQPYRVVVPPRRPHLPRRRAAARRERVCRAWRRRIGE
jgi:hypothetical protein